MEGWRVDAGPRRLTWRPLSIRIDEKGPGRFVVFLG